MGVVEKEIKMAKEIAEVRKTGATNMFDRYNVVKVLEMFGYEDTAYTVSKMVASEYIHILKLSGEY